MTPTLKSVPEGVTVCIEAKYDGSCFYCEKKIIPGELIFKLVKDGDQYWCMDPWCGQKEKESEN